MGVFHRRCLQQIVGLDRDVRNEMVYLLSTTVPLHVFRLKQFKRTMEHCAAHDRLISAYFKWQRTIEHDVMRKKLTVCKIADACRSFVSVDDIYKQWQVEFKRRLSSVTKYRGTYVGQVV